jgi:hypothetical protein
MDLTAGMIQDLTARVANVTLEASEWKVRALTAEAALAEIEAEADADADEDTEENE